MEGVVTPEFYRGKRVLITGHTGFKGTWFCRMLANLGAEVTGYALSSPTNEGTRIFQAAVKEDICSIEGDVRSLSKLLQVFERVQPEIVFHLAAQPIVLTGYREPLLTYETNIMGTVNILECIRRTESVRSFLNVTTDKVYENKEWYWGYREGDSLGGYDPYSNSKSCSELVTRSYQKSFFQDSRCAIATARAGNVIGGGDFSPNRILPDCIRAARKGERIKVRNPYSVRPYQYVLEPLYAYLLIAQSQYENPKYAGCYNVGPAECDCVSTGELVNIFCKLWGENISWEYTSTEAPHEAKFLKLDCSKIKIELGWTPRWHIREAVRRTVEWTKIYYKNEDIREVMSRQIKDFMGGYHGQ